MSKALATIIGEAAPVRDTFLPGIDSGTLGHVIKYCNYHHQAAAQSVTESAQRDWDQEFRLMTKPCSALSWLHVSCTSDVARGTNACRDGLGGTRSSNKVTICCAVARRTDEHQRQGDSGGTRLQINIPSYSPSNDTSITAEHEEIT